MKALRWYGKDDVRVETVDETVDEPVIENPGDAIIMSCRKGGTISIPGVYIGFGDKIPIGAAMNKGLTIKQGQTDTHKYMPMLLDKIETGQIDPSFVITHRMPLVEAPNAYDLFKNKEDKCIKVVLTP
ncbi:hypothetical protein BH24ACI3_BH24ACI3_04800 [soil metagenome]